MTRCKHCGKPIVHRTGVEWRHTARNTIWCHPGLNSKLATPEETR